MPRLTHTSLLRTLRSRDTGCVLGEELGWESSPGFGGFKWKVTPKNPYSCKTRAIPSGLGPLRAIGSTEEMANQP